MNNISQFDYCRLYFLKKWGGKLNEIKYKWLFHKSYFRVCTGANAKIGRNITIKNSRIIVTPGSCVEIGDNVRIENAVLSIDSGACVIGNNSIIGSASEKVMLNIESGKILIGHHSKISASRFWVRFGGNIHIGDYTNINSGSEIRCDEVVSIGDYNQISYNVNIWDTNTHNVYSKDARRHITEEHYPYYGYESKRPKTKPVIIGNDCWIGEKASILKGTIINDEVIVGYNCLLCNVEIPSKTTVVTKSVLDIHKRE